MCADHYPHTYSVHVRQVQRIWAWHARTATRLHRFKSVYVCVPAGGGSEPSWKINMLLQEAPLAFQLSSEPIHPSSVQKTLFWLSSRVHRHVYHYKKHPCWIAKTCLHSARHGRLHKGNIKGRGGQKRLLLKAWLFTSANIKYGMTGWFWKV